MGALPSEGKAPTDEVQTRYADSLTLISLNQAGPLSLPSPDAIPSAAAPIPVPFPMMIGQNFGLRSVFEAIQKVAQTDATILITGESGTGKELVSQAVHQLSQRKNAPLVVVNCGAIPGELLESELFGHVRGSFTGALQNKPGRIEMAEGGTLFLDEVGELPLALQVKLLRFLQEKSFEAVGSLRPQKCDVRIIAATNRVLEEAIKDKSFREDLYYRLNVIPIHMPPLRERRCDIPLLVEHFLQKFNSQEKRCVRINHSNVMDLLTRYDWPGNVRELENLMERLVVLTSTDEVQLSDLPSKIFEHLELMDSEPGTQGQFSFATHAHEVAKHPFLDLEKGIQCPRFILPESGINLKALLEEFETDILMQALSRTHGNKNRASELLQLNRTTLVEKLKKRSAKADEKK